MFRAIGTGRKETSSFTKPHKKKLTGWGSGDRGGREVDSLPRPIHRSDNCLFKNVFTSLWMCGGAPSCWNTFGSSWSNWGINHSTNMWHLSRRHRTSVLYFSGKSCNYFLRIGKNNFLSFSLQWRAFNFCVAITFLLTNVCNRLNHFNLFVPHCICTYACVLRITNQVLIKDARWQRDVLQVLL
jgi:hypothetical protein